MAIAPFTVPGVYRQDVFPRPTPALPTGVPVFIGFGTNGDPEAADLLTLQKLTLWPQFAELVSRLHPSEFLSRAVHGFFANGGDFCYVVMVPLSSTKDRDTALQEGLEAAAGITDIDLVCIPDLMQGSPAPADLQRWQQRVLDHCDRTNDRFAILDAPLTLTPGETSLRGTNGALYGPWVMPEQGNQWVPPCGHVAGSMARCDRTYGVHHAPANLVLEDVLDLSQRLTDADHQRLNQSPNPTRINYLRALPGRGIRAWGAYTLSSDPNWHYVNVRRLFITLGRWADLNLTGLAFEPNDFSLWVRMERELTAYLQSLASQGALQGSTAEEAFFVKCDGETNSPEVRDRGQVVATVGLAPTLPNEFIVVRLIHGDTGTSLVSAA